MTSKNLSGRANSVNNRAFTLVPVAGELRIHDLEIGERLGFERPRDIRKLIERHLENLNKINHCATVARRSESGGRGVTEYYLDRKQSIFICMKSNTDNAIDVQMEIIEVYDTYLNSQSTKLPNFSNPAEAARAWASEYESKIALEKKTKILEQQIEEIKPLVALADAVTGNHTMYRRDWIAMMKKEVGNKLKEKAVNEWLMSEGYIYKGIDGISRAYSNYDHLFKLEPELINGVIRPILKITGVGVNILTPIVQAHFS